jgi:hypothetical protein
MALRVYSGAECIQGIPFRPVTQGLGYKFFYHCNSYPSALIYHVFTVRHHCIQHYDTQHDDTQQNATQYNDTHHNESHHNDTQHK